FARSGLGSFRYWGKAASSSRPPNEPPNRSAQCAYTDLKLMAAVLGSLVSIDVIWSYPVVWYAPVVFMMARHVKSKSFEVTGLASAQVASGNRRNVTVKGFSVSPRFSSDGA